MKTIGAYLAKTHLSEILDQVKQGQKMCITKKGMPIAMLIPFESTQTKKPEQAIADLKNFRRKIRLKKNSLKKMIQEGRRF